MEYPVCKVRLDNGKIVVFPSKLEIVTKYKNEWKTTTVSLRELKAIEVFKPRFGVGYVHISLDGNMHLIRRPVRAKKQQNCLFIRTRQQYIEVMNAIENLEIILREGFSFDPLILDNKLAVTEKMKKVVTEHREKIANYKLHSVLTPIVGTLVGLIEFGNAPTFMKAIMSILITFAWVILIVALVKVLRSTKLWRVAKEKKIQLIDRAQAFLAVLTIMCLFVF
jgi:hypothetical protein